MAFRAALKSLETVPGINAVTVGLSPAMAMGNLFMATSLALSESATNSVIQQQKDWQTGSAIMCKSIANMWAYKKVSSDDVGNITIN